jgi:hypothetical protein
MKVRVLAVIYSYSKKVRGPRESLSSPCPTSPYQEQSDDQTRDLRSHISQEQCMFGFVLYHVTVVKLIYSCGITGNSKTTSFPVSRRYTDVKESSLYSSDVESFESRRLCASSIIKN